MLLAVSVRLFQDNNTLRFVYTTKPLGSLKTGWDRQIKHRMDPFLSLLYSDSSIPAKRASIVRSLLYYRTICVSNLSQAHTRFRTEGRCGPLWLLPCLMTLMVRDGSFYNKKIFQFSFSFITKQSTSVGRQNKCNKATYNTIHNNHATFSGKGSEQLIAITRAFTAEWQECRWGTSCKDRSGSGGRR